MVYHVDSILLSCSGDSLLSLGTAVFANFWFFMAFDLGTAASCFHNFHFILQIAVVDKYETVFDKLNKELRLLNESVKALNNSNGELTEQTTERLAVNVTQLESRVQELKKFSNNMTSIAGSLERGYTQMNTLMKTLEAVNGAQNASQDNLWSFYNSLNDALATVNATMNDQVRLSATEFN